MPHVVKRIARSTTAKLNNYAGPAGELFMDTATNDLVLQNGQAGGVRLAKAATAITADNGLSVTAGGTLAATTTVSGVDATTAAKGVVQLSSATDSASETTAATPKAVSDALQEAKDYADTAGAPYSGTAPIAVDATNRVISVTDATTAAKGVVQVGDNVTANNGVISVKPWAVHSATAAAVDVADVQEGAIIQTDEPVGGDLTAVLADVEQTLTGSPAFVPSSFAVKSAMESVLAPVYVNGTTGDDNNDGMTAATAVRTINRALVLASNRGVSDPSNDNVTINIAAGTYAGFVCRHSVNFVIEGTVTISGDSYVVDGAKVLLFGDNNSNFIVNGVFHVEFYALFLQYAPMTVNGVIVSAADASYGVRNRLSVNYVAGPYGMPLCPVYVAENGTLIVSPPGSLSINHSDALGVGVDAYSGGVFVLYDGASLSISGYAYAALRAHLGGIVLIHRGSTYTVSGNYTWVHECFTNATLMFAPEANISGNPTGARFHAVYNSCIFTHGSGPYRLPGSTDGVVDTSGFYY